MSTVFNRTQRETAPLNRGLKTRTFFDMSRPLVSLFFLPVQVIFMVGRVLEYGGLVVLSDIVSIFKLVAEGFAGAGGELKKALIHSMVYVVVGLFLFATWHVIKADGDLGKGLKAAFVDSYKDTDVHAAQLHADQMQYELKSVVASDRLVERIMSTVLNTVPNAARMRMGIIHNGVSGITGIGMLRFDVTNVVVNPGRGPGQTVQNLPLSQWNSFLQDLLSDKCVVVGYQDVKDPEMRERLQATTSTSFLGCPIVDVSNQTLGGVFILWDGADRPPIGTELEELMARTKLAGRQIGAALDLRVANQLPDH